MLESLVATAAAVLLLLLLLFYRCCSLLKMSLLSLAFSHPSFAFYIFTPSYIGLPFSIFDVSSANQSDLFIFSLRVLFFFPSVLTYLALEYILKTNKKQKIISRSRQIEKRGKQYWNVKISPKELHDLVGSNASCNSSWSGSCSFIFVEFWNFLSIIFESKKGSRYYLQEYWIFSEQIHIF